MNTKPIYLKLIIIASVLLALAQIGKFIIVSGSETINYDEKIINRIELTNLNLPQELDEYTILNSISKQDQLISYNFILKNINFSEAAIKNLKVTQQKINIETACNAKDLSSYLNNDYQIIYNYFDENNNTLFINKIVERDC